MCSEGPVFTVYADVQTSEKIDPRREVLIGERVTVGYIAYVSAGACTIVRLRSAFYSGDLSSISSKYAFEVKVYAPSLKGGMIIPLFGVTHSTK
jgi:hypothetical protein